MVKTIRIENEDIHTDLLKIQGKIQAETGELTKMEKVLEELIDCCNKNRCWKKSK